MQQASAMMLCLADYLKQSDRHDWPAKWALWAFALFPGAAPLASLASAPRMLTWHSFTHFDLLWLRQPDVQPVLLQVTLDMVYGETFHWHELHDTLGSGFFRTA
jgi:hypothetical protein